MLPPTYVSDGTHFLGYQAQKFDMSTCQASIVNKLIVQHSPSFFKGQFMQILSGLPGEHFNHIFGQENLNNRAHIGRLISCTYYQSPHISSGL